MILVSSPTKRSSTGPLPALAFAGIWVALAAAALTASGSLVLGCPARGAVLALAFGGTLCVYGLDRLRDLERDGDTAPVRSAFVARHRGALTSAVIAGAMIALAGAVYAGDAVAAIAAPILVVGLLHRRLKRVPLLKPWYLTAAWLAVTVAIPALAAPTAPPRVRLAWVVSVQGLAILANAIASSVRDREGTAALLGTHRALALARTAALAGTLLGLLAPPPVRPLAAVPIAMVVALARFRATESYGLVVVDGALLAGALATVAVTVASG